MTKNHGALENVILDAIWRLEEDEVNNVTVSLVQNHINNIQEKSWAYTTVKTVLDRLVEKSIIARFKLGKKFCYQAVFTREEQGKIALEKIAKLYYKNNAQALHNAIDTIYEENLALV